MAFTGVDLSEHNGKIDWTKLKSHINFAILRVGYGTSTLDKRFEENIINARTAGVPIPAVYHFSYALTPEDARIEAAFVIKELHKMGVPEDTVVYFDYEEDSLRYAKTKNTNPTPKSVFEIMETFVNNIKQAGYKAGVYANSEFFTKWFNKLNGIPNCKFWYADWRTNPDKNNVALCDIHQTSDKGSFPGISGKVDTDVSNTILKVEVTEHKSEVTTTKPEVKKLTNEQIADEVIAGKWGNGEERRKKLTEAGYNYNDIQKIVDYKVKVKSNDKTNEQVAQEVINGVWGNGDERKRKLEANGYNYNDIQKIVNMLIASKNRTVSPAKEFDKTISGTYSVTAAAVNLRYIPGVLTDNNVMKIVYKNEPVQCFGYYTTVEGTRWLYVQYKNYTGYINAKFLKKN